MTFETEPSIAAEAGEQVLLLFSGGLDSILSWHSLQESGYRVEALTIDFDGRPKGEISACDRLLTELGCQRLHRLTLVGWGHLPSAAPPLAVLPELRAGFIPHRNLVFWSLAASIAVRYGYTTIAAGHTADDARDFNDASCSFFARLSEIIGLAGTTDAHLRLRLPLASLSDDGASLAKRLPPHLLHQSWSCWLDGTTPCRHCLACRKREKFLAGLICRSGDRLFER